MTNELERYKPEGVEPLSTVPTALVGAAITAQAHCPFCHELISANARKCKHCGETVDVAMRKAEEAMRYSERQSNVYMNAGGGGGGAASALADTGRRLRPFKHFMHIVLSILTAGLWIPVWLLMYIFRNREVYE